MWLLHLSWLCFRCESCKMFVTWHCVQLGGNLCKRPFPCHSFVYKNTQLNEHNVPHSLRLLCLSVCVSSLSLFLSLSLSLSLTLSLPPLTHTHTHTHTQTHTHTHTHTQSKEWKCTSSIKLQHTPAWPKKGKKKPNIDTALARTTTHDHWAPP